MRLKVLLVVAMALAVMGAEANTNEVVRCKSVTQSGSQCKRRAAKGEHYCRQHAVDAPVKKSPETCRAMAEDGKVCTEKPLANRRYCGRHSESRCKERTAK